MPCCRKAVLYASHHARATSKQADHTCSAARSAVQCSAVRCQLPAPAPTPSPSAECHHANACMHSDASSQASHASISSLWLLFAHSQSKSTPDTTPGPDPVNAQAPYHIRRAIMVEATRAQIKADGHACRRGKKRMYERKMASAVAMLARSCSSPGYPENPQALLRRGCCAPSTGIS